MLEKIKKELSDCSVDFEDKALLVLCKNLAHALDQKSESCKRYLVCERELKTETEDPPEEKKEEDKLDLGENEDEDTDEFAVTESAIEALPRRVLTPKPNHR